MSRLPDMDRRTLLRVGTVAALSPAVSGCAGSDFKVSPDTNRPVGKFDDESTAEEVTEGLNLKGKVALVTGCNSGLGYETMRVLALRGAHVIGTGRTLEKAQRACERVQGVTTPLALELSNFESVAECAKAVADLGMGLDILVCNAGVNTFSKLQLIGGVESMFVINHLGHFLLSHRLLPVLRGAAEARIVHVGSRSGYTQAPAAGIDFENLRGEGPFDAGEAYGRSKLANALFSNELARRLAGTQVSSNVIHPGLVRTNIARTAPAVLRGAFNMFGGLIAKTVEQGAATQTYVATTPSLAGVSGAYFEDCNPVIVSGDHHMYDEEMAKRLWAESELMVKPYL